MNWWWKLLWLGDEHRVTVVKKIQFSNPAGWNWRFFPMEFGRIFQANSHGETHWEYEKGNPLENEDVERPCYSKTLVHHLSNLLHLTVVGSFFWICLAPTAFWGMTSSGQDSASTFRPTARTTQLGVNEFRPTGRGVNHKDGNGHLQEYPLGLKQRFVEHEFFRERLWRFWSHHSPNGFKTLTWKFWILQ